MDTNPSVFSKAYLHVKQFEEKGHINLRRTDGWAKDIQLSTAGKKMLMLEAVTIMIAANRLAQGTVQIILRVCSSFVFFFRLQGFFIP